MKLRVVSLLSAPASVLQLELSPDANIARYLDIRPPRPARPSFPLPTVEQRERTVARLRRRATASDASMVAGSG